MKPVYAHRYRMTLRSQAANARSSRREVEGLLIRSLDGFGCVHPWPELGDPTVDELLAALREGKRHRLLDRALACATEDGEARRAGRSLFIRDAAATPPGSGITIPLSHATITGDADFPALVAVGFRAVKLKTHGSDPALPERVAAAVAAGLKVRIDCNGTGIATLAALQPWSQSIDFIEDPEPYDPDRWRAIKAELGFRLALDRLPDGMMENGGYDVRILKPALDECAERGEEVVITSYMDHPLGQMFAALEAARYPGRQLEAGLLTHSLFEPDAFTEAVRANGPQLLPPAGTGLGFDALLESLPWEILSTRGKAAVDFAWPEFWQRSEPLLLTNPRAPLNDPPQDLPDGCLVFPTSGSTGPPSLICLSRSAMLASAAAVNEWLGATSDDVWLRTLPNFHVGGLSIHARASLTRSRVICDDEKWNPQRFTELAGNESVTLTSLVPAQVHDLISGGFPAPQPLRAVIVGGGAMDAAVFRQGRALGWPLLPSYGMTEAASQVATARPGDHSSLPPLELLPCWEARTDAAGRLQLRGAPLLSGRLIRTGAGWKMEPAVDPDGWFTTADRAVLHGRILTIAGRCDRLVKVLGELVDLDAIEAALAAAGMPPGRGAVIALPDIRAGSRPWLVTDLSESETPALLAAANAALPPFATIAGSRHLAKLPRSPLGKILRSELESRL